MLEVSLAIADYDRVRALGDGSVSPEGVKLSVLNLAPSETFYRMLKHEQFDVSEMSISSYLISRQQGRGLIALPVFPFRGFFHTSIYVNRAAEIKGPKDLEGRRVGLTEYQVTAAVWTRSVLHHHFGVDLTKVRWSVERPPEMSHGGITGFRPPEGISIEGITADATLGSLLESGELDAVLPDPYPRMASRLNRTDEADLRLSPAVRTLFPDPKAEALRYMGVAGAPQVNHTVVVRGEVLAGHPWLAAALYQAFEEAKRAAYAELEQIRRTSVVFAPYHLAEQHEVFGPDPYPYGLSANSATLETLIDSSFEQGLIPKRPTLESLFVADLLDT